MIAALNVRVSRCRVNIVLPARWHSRETPVILVVSGDWLWRTEWHCWHVDTDSRHAKRSAIHE